MQGHARAAGDGVFVELKDFEHGDVEQRRVELPDPLVRSDGVGIRLHLGLEVPDLEQRPSVVRIVCD